MKQISKFLLSEYWLELSALAFGALVMLAVGVTAADLWRVTKVETIAAKSNQQPTPSPAATSSHVLQKGQLVKVDVQRLALEAWNKDKLLPGKDMQYDWFKIGMYIADWKQYFRDHGIIVDDKAFGAAYSAIAQRSEARLKDRAFQASQE